ncbi:MAG: chromate efflux transporter [Bacteroidota bacterium]
MPQAPSLAYLFRTFLKIGAASFGGNVALVAVVQREMVEKDQSLDNDAIVEAVSVGSVMPGPLAVNTVTYLGYQLRGFPGALVSMFAVLLPAFFLVLGLSWAYFTYRELPILDRIFGGILPGVMAIILSVAFSMGQKNIKDPWQWGILVVSFIALLFIRAFWLSLILVMLAALVGIWRYETTVQSDHVKPDWRLLRRDLLKVLCWILGAMALIVGLEYMITRLFPEHNILLDLFNTFGGMGISLFGGGYVFIPAIGEVVVNQHQWLNPTEFTDAIAMGQITPGPILISATFIGYKMAGIPGAVVATVAMFLPPGLLMVLAARYFALLRTHPRVQAAFMGIKASVVGLIAAAVFVIGKGIDNLNIFSLLIFCLVLLLSIRYKLSPLYLIPGAAFLGWLLF